MAKPEEIINFLFDCISEDFYAYLKKLEIDGKRYELNESGYCLKVDGEYFFLIIINDN